MRYRCLVDLFASFRPHTSHVLSTLLRLIAVLLMVCAAAEGADWPTYLHDNARSGVTSEQLRLPLSTRWVFQARYAPEPAWETPQPVPIEGYLELPRIRFDDAFHVAVVGNSVYFGSSADNKVYCLDASTGRERWSFFTNGPVRLAPTVSNGRVYVCSDDGYVYCLGAADGRLIWKFRAAPHDDRVLGNEKLISLWPPRTGVLVDEGVAYCTAGVFPAEGIYVYALRASDGTIIWRNDTCGESGAGLRGISLQGYLLASKEHLFTPMGRVSPAAFDRKDGQLIYSGPFFGKGTGASYALLTDEYVVSGIEQIVAYGQGAPRPMFAWFPGRKLIVTRDFSYMLNDIEMSAIERTTYGKASVQYKTAKDSQLRLKSKLRILQRDRAKIAAKAAAAPQTLEAAQKQLDTMDKQIDELKRQLEALAEVEKTAHAEMSASVKWRLPCDAAESMILARGVLFAGGKDKVVAADAEKGRELWTAKVNGKARGLAVANGHLFVSSDTGAIYCFGGPGTPKLGELKQTANPSPYKEDQLTPVFKSAAEAIVQETGINRGYCLMLGCGTGRLALELAKRTDLTIYAVEPEEQKVEMARKAIDTAGMYGKRVSVERWSLSNIPYADYFANLIVSESALVSGEAPGDAKEMFRMLKPLGGVAYIGQPAEARGIGKPLKAAALREWVQVAEVKGASVTEGRGVWLKLVRGPLPGAGKWTHQFADPGNTASSDDEVVKCPLGILWFGGPGPTRMPSRHANAAAPLALNGRLFVQGENVVMAYDAYNGLKLWERDIPGAIRLRVKQYPSNLAASDDSLFVAVGDTCLRLGPATGDTKSTYSLPPSEDEEERKWGYTACVGKLLFGSTTRDGANADAIFANDIRTGRRRWLYPGNGIMHTTIAIGDGRLFFAERNATDEQRQEALKERTEQLTGLSGEERAKAEEELKKADVRVVVALDAATGKPGWKKPIDVSNCVRIGAGGSDLSSIYTKGILLLCGAPGNGHFWREFFAGEFSRRSIIALSGKNGKLVWSGKLGYRTRPLVIGETLIADPWAYDVRTGEPKKRVHPITGELVKWQIARPGHHCGWIAGCPSSLFFRSHCIGYYDLIGDYGTMHFGAQRTGCCINFIPANGVVLIPEASSGCMCPFSNMCTVVLKPRETNRAWGMFSSPGAVTPVKHMAINLGAPGDRKDEKGTLWLSYPRPITGTEPFRTRLVLQLSLGTSILEECGFFRHNPETLEIAGTDKPWVFASGCAGLTRCVVPLISEGEPPAAYTVRLAFAEPLNERPGQRVFDIKLQDRLVAEDFDICKAAGGRCKAITKEFENIHVDDDLVLELMPRAATPTLEQAPLINGIEVVRTQTFRAAIKVPDVLLSNVRPEKNRTITIVNHTDEPLVGTLETQTPRGVVVRPQSAKVRIPPGEQQTVDMQVGVAAEMPAGDYPLEMKVLGSGGKIESQRTVRVIHLGPKRDLAVNAVEDTYVRQNVPETNYGSAERLGVDGGSKEMGDEHHSIGYLRFRFDEVPGRPIRARIRLHVHPAEGSQSGDAGRIVLVEGEWEENSVTYDTQPALGEEIGRVGPIKAGETIERPLDVPLEGRSGLSVAIVPTSCDGAGYYAREGGHPAELIVEFGP